VIELSPQATAQIAQLEDHYDQIGRPEAIRNLANALAEASDRIERDPAAGLPAPRPYPQLARPGRIWMKAGRYWIAYRRSPRLAIVAVFYETANIPKRQ
jgi:plasmid stabilization system protein ParE